MTFYHVGTGHTGEDRDLDSHMEDTGGIDISPNNDNESTNSSDTMIALGGLGADGHLTDFLHSSQANLTILTREINSLQQCIEARAGQPAEGLYCIKWELQNLSLMLRVQPTSTPAPSEPSREVIH